VNLPVEPSLKVKRCLLQQQLRCQRQDIIAQLDGAGDIEPQFPRSATMRFFAGRAGLKLVMEFAVRRLAQRYPGLLVNAFALMRLVR